MRAAAVAAAIVVTIVACKDRPPSPPTFGSATPIGTTPSPPVDAAAPPDAGPPAGKPAPPPAVACGSRPRPVGVLYAGNPLYRGDEPPSPAGAGFRADPPIGWRDVVFAGERVFTAAAEEIWAGTPDTTMRRIVGQRSPGAVRFRAGPCADARLAYVNGMAALPDGSLIVADANGNALVKVTDPTGAKCMVSYYAGTGAPADGVLAADPPHLGNADGAGDAAQFRLPFQPVADAAGTVYVLDQGNGTIRKVTPERDRGRVTTLAFSMPEVQWNDLALHGDKLIVVGQAASGVDSLVVQVDPATGAHEVLVRGGGEAFPPADPGRSTLLSAVASDGKRIFVAGSSRIWEIDGHRVKHLAGGFSSNELIDFPRDRYDPAAEHPALALQLRHSIGDTRTAQFLTYHDGSLYWSARAHSEYVVRITCLP